MPTPPPPPFRTRRSTVAGSLPSRNALQTFQPICIEVKRGQRVLHFTRQPPHPTIVWGLGLFRASDSPGSALAPLSGSGRLLGSRSCGSGCRSGPRAACARRAARHGARKGPSTCVQLPSTTLRPADLLPGVLHIRKTDSVELFRLQQSDLRPRSWEKLRTPSAT